MGTSVKQIRLDQVLKIVSTGQGSGVNSDLLGWMVKVVFNRDQATINVGNGRGQLELGSNELFPNLDIKRKH